MKLSKYKSIIFALMLFEISIFSCSKKNPKTIEEWEGQVAPTFIFRTVSVPDKMKQSPDSMAQKVVEYVGLINECNKYRAYLIPLENYSTKTEKGPPWITTWQAPEGYTIFLTIEGEVGGVSYTWEVKFWGTDSTTGIYYNRWVFIEADQVAFDQAGGIRVYQNNSLKYAAYYNWTTSHNQLTYTMSMFDEGNIILNLEFFIYNGLAGDLFTKRDNFTVE